MLSRMSIRWRLILFHVLTMLGIAAVLIFGLFVIFGIAVANSVEQQAEARSNEAARIVESTGTLTADNLAVLNRDNVMIFALDGEGRVVSQTGFGLQLGTQLPQGEWSRTLIRGEGLEDEVRGALDLWDDRAIFIHTETVGEPGGGSADNPGTGSSSPIASVGAGVSYDWVGQTQFEWITIALAGFGVVAFVLVTIGSFVLVRHSLAPVQAIAETAAEIGEHDLSRRLPVRSERDELGNLAVTFNELLARLDTAFRDRERTLEQQRRFVADASHELRTPLTSILGYARMLRAWGLERPEVAREAVDSLEREAVRMEALVNGMLQLTRGDEGAPLLLEPRDLGQLVLDAIDLILAANLDEVTIDANLSSGPERPGSPDRPEGMVATVDANQIHRVLMILLDNAVKFSPRGGRVQVTLGAEPDAVEICVTDTGPGIP
ncbi:MAG TPA: HAMP domain-containing sensor histidine kinase, partial [Thermomicrobiales bacterium]|nr:HAMP domain-containing sensor histidine kinase [Thermomicrobiales bacterium]